MKKSKEITRKSYHWSAKLGAISSKIHINSAGFKELTRREKLVTILYQLMGKDNFGVEEEILLIFCL